MKKTVFVYSLQLVCALLSAVFFAFGNATAALILGITGIIDGFLSFLTKDELMGEEMAIPCTLSSLLASVFLAIGVFVSWIEGAPITQYDLALMCCIGLIIGICLWTCIAAFTGFRSITQPQIENGAIFSLWFFDTCNICCSSYLFYFSGNGNVTGGVLCSILVLLTSLISAIVYFKTQYKYGHSIFHSVLTGFLLAGVGIPFLISAFFVDFSSYDFTMVGFIACFFSVLYHLIMQIVNSVHEMKKPEFIDWEQ